MHKYAIIVAGGSGSRMNTAVPKQFMLLNGKPVLYYTLKAFLEAYNDMRIVLVLPKDHINKGKEIVDTYFFGAAVEITAGGETRFHSVKNGLALADNHSVVFVHDAVRCLITPSLIRKCYDAVIQNGSAIPVINAKDSIRLLNKDENKAVDRNLIKLVQTPQVFFARDLIPAFNTEYREDFTDEASVVEARGMKVHLVEGEETNIKITHPADLHLAEYLISNH